MTLNKITRFLHDLNDEDLLELYRVLASKDSFFLNLVTEEITNRNMRNHKLCAVCGSPLRDDYFELRFGKLDLRKRAYFCGVDCLLYFIDKNFLEYNNVKNNDVSYESQKSDNSPVINLGSQKLVDLYKLELNEEKNKSSIQKEILRRVKEKLNYNKRQKNVDNNIDKINHYNEKNYLNYNYKKSTFLSSLKKIFF